MASRSARRHAEATARRARGRARPQRQGRGDPARALRAARHARLDPDRRRPRRPPAARRGRLRAVQITDAELREDVNVLNVVNFGGGSYVLYAEIHEDGTIEVDPEPYSRQLRPPGAAAARRGQGADRRDRPDRRPPARGRARERAREDRRGARRRPARAGPAGREQRRRRLQVARVVSRAISESKLLKLDYYKPNEDEFTRARRRALRARQRPRGLVRRGVRPGEGRRPPFPPRPRAQGDRRAQGLQAASRGRPGGRRRRLAAHRRGRGLADRARLDVARARALGARGPARQPGAVRRLGRSSSSPTRASPGSCAACSRRPATPRCSSPKTRAPPCWTAATRLRPAARA